VLLLFDADKAGQAATWRGMDVLLRAGLETRVVTLAAGEDPDSFLAKQGPEAFAERLHQARPALEAFLDHALAQEDGSVEGRVRAARQVAERIALLPDPLQRDLYLKEAARRTGVDEELLRRQARPAVRPPSPVPPPAFAPPLPPEPPPGDGDWPPPPPPSAPSRSGPPPRGAAPVRRHPSAAERAQRLLLRLLLLSPTECRQVADDGVEAYFIEPALAAVAERLCALPQREGEVDPAVIAAELPADQQALLQEVATLDAALVAEAPALIRRDCRQAVARERSRQRRREVQARLQVTTDAQELTELQRELIRLKKEL